MAAAFTQRSVGLLGSGVRVLALLVLVNAAAFVCTQKGQRRRVAVTFAAFAAAFAAFYLFHLFLYYYNFAQVEALALKDYDRYIGPYYMGWMLASLYMLGRGAAEGCRPRMGRLAVLAVWVLGRFRGSFPVSVVLVALSMGIYQAYITVPVMLLLMYLIDRLISREAEWKPILKKSVQLFI